MRFQLEKPLTSEDFGRRRFIEKFLWFPKEINHEIRWLEKAVIEQEVTFTIEIDTDCIEMSYRRYYWRDSKWIDPPVFLR